jgi:predicted nucleotidyltransferase
LCSSGASLRPRANDGLEETPLPYTGTTRLDRSLHFVALKATFVALLATDLACVDLASLLFGAYRRSVLALLLLHPEASLHVREIARATAKAPGTLLRELNALAEAGVLTRQRVGNQVHFQANAACPIFHDLRNVLKKTVGVADVLREVLAPLAGKIRAAFVYGSIARGDERASSDVDLMVVGEASFADVVAALAPAHELLRREVNPNVYPALEFRRKLAAGEPFLKRVLAERKIFIIGDQDDLGQSRPHRKAKGARRR